ncbi:serine carboxypeptidase S28-domain-containing protein [Penicillium angulare]|uniref:serine carboxypeptidase S28-domain-containing protein n=1 Tax=Penicillium angulare TaxID=116970 RepID=UPI0025411A09|nr:serine carboxypeptidase S28-domain-containing protein [Penicillium angulare]KAJ5261208.1 serine carboxypeptidase S28-domain-containing protein [Penicillium angulare]
MKAFSLVVALLVAHGAAAARSHSRTGSKRQYDSESGPTVPSYYFDVPVDHFSSNTDTYKNLYYVNDTYYKTGGPVILQDMGEEGFTQSAAQIYMAEEDARSASMELARQLHGIVIGWEHRYYGRSLPVEIDDETYVPKQGLGGYKYLTVQQALEDVAYFANNFNKTDLADNKVIKSTASLDPYHTPWIFIGGSYPGSRAAWLRLTHPEIIYASWASSAPVQTQYDGSLYFDPIARALPKNCTNDFAAAAKYIDETFKSGTEAELSAMEYAYSNIFSYGEYDYDYSDESDFSDDYSNEVTAYAIGEAFADLIAGGGQYQDAGAATTTQLICDYMEGFDVKGFKKGVSDASSRKSILSVLEDLDSSDSDFPIDGVAASIDGNGDYYAFWAAIWGAYNFYQNDSYYLSVKRSRSPRGRKLRIPDAEEDTTIPDNYAWIWQTLQEVGYYQASNDSNNGESYPLLSDYFNTSSFRIELIESFEDYSSSDFPTNLNNSWLESLGGWNIKASNVMFTNGEFDPWRAFSVATQESHAGAPNRTITQDVPACNKVSDGQDVFGVVYDGAVHASDLVWWPGIDGGQANLTKPLDDGVHLFLNAWSVWSKCFNTSRDDIRNGKGVDGSGHGANGSTPSSDPGSGSSDNSDDKKNAASRATEVLSFASLGALVAGLFVII